MSPSEWLDWWSNLLGFIGVFILFIPAWKYNITSRLLKRFQDSRDSILLESDFQEKDKVLENYLVNKKNDWTPFQEWCLLIGHILVFLSFGLKFFT